MQNINEKILFLSEIQDVLGAVRDLRTVLVETSLSALTEAIEAIRKGWRFDYSSETYSSGCDYDDHGGTEQWELSGPGLPESKYWNGEWDYRSHEGGPSAKEVLEAGDISSVCGRSNPKHAGDVVRALQTLTAIFPKKGD